MSERALRSRIESLEEEVEIWRQRAEAAERRGGNGDNVFDRCVPPLTLAQTRILRLLVDGGQLTPKQLVTKLEDVYPRTSEISIRTMVSRMRTQLPALAPLNDMSGHHSAGYRLPDREGARRFLAGA